MSPANRTAKEIAAVRRAMELGKVTPEDGQARIKALEARGAVYVARWELPNGAERTKSFKGKGAEKKAQEYEIEQKAKVRRREHEDPHALRVTVAEVLAFYLAKLEGRESFKNVRAHIRDIVDVWGDRLTLERLDRDPDALTFDGCALVGMGKSNRIRRIRPFPPGLDRSLFSRGSQPSRDISGTSGAPRAARLPSRNNPSWPASLLKREGGPTVATAARYNSEGLGSCINFFGRATLHPEGVDGKAFPSAGKEHPARRPSIPNYGSQAAGRTRHAKCMPPNSRSWRGSVELAEMPALGSSLQHPQHGGQDNRAGGFRQIGDSHEQFLSGTVREGAGGLGPRPGNDPARTPGAPEGAAGGQPGRRERSDRGLGFQSGNPEGLGSGAESFPPRVGAKRRGAPSGATRPKSLGCSALRAGAARQEGTQKNFSILAIPKSRISPRNKMFQNSTMAREIA